MRSTDVAGRYGGEEFIIIQPQSTAEGSAILAGRFRQAVEAARYEVPGHSPLQVTMSLGVSQYRKVHTSPDDLMAAADRALYAAKGQGRNQVVLAD